MRVTCQEPTAKALILTHILQTNFAKEPNKPSDIVENDRASALSIRLSSMFPKVWVKDRLLAMGMKAAPPTGGRTRGTCSLLCYTVCRPFARFKRRSGSVGSLT